MKRAMPWSDEEENSSSNESSSSRSDSEAEDGFGRKKAKHQSKAGQASKEKKSKDKSGKQNTGVVDFEELKRHGYKGGPSVLKVPPPKDLDDKKHDDWSWSTGKESRETKKIEESYEDRQKTRAALAYGEQLASVETRKEKNLSFSQKEKRKREIGQASRGKSYVEEEKRMLRESGIYSGFDT